MDSRFVLSFPKRQTERPLFPKADVRIQLKPPKTGSAFGQKRSFA